MWVQPTTEVVVWKAAAIREPTARMARATRTTTTAMRRTPRWAPPSFVPASWSISGFSFRINEIRHLSCYFFSRACLISLFYVHLSLVYTFCAKKDTRNFSNVLKLQLSLSHKTSCQQDHATKIHERRHSSKKLVDFFYICCVTEIVQNFFIQKNMYPFL